eukprot:scaffold150418_cov17-Tisochrysis_lutea.AAC.1
MLPCHEESFVEGQSVNKADTVLLRVEDQNKGPCRTWSFPHFCTSFQCFLPAGTSNPSAVQQTDKHMAYPMPASVHPHNGGFLDMLYDVAEMRAQLDAVEEGAGRAYLGWLSKARTALEVRFSMVKVQAVEQCQSQQCEWRHALSQKLLFERLLSCISRHEAYDTRGWMLARVLLPVNLLFDLA